MDFSLSIEEKNRLLQTARESILSALEGRSSQYPEPSDNLKTECGAFVTLHKNGQLRGCIGHIQAAGPLFDAVIELARSSAFKDPRFPPLSPEEYEKIDIEISVLTPLKEINDISVIEVGKHGIYIQRGYASGVLLPQVATEQGWDRETFLKHTCMKAGMSGDCYKQSDTRIWVFSAIIFGEKQ